MKRERTPRAGSQEDWAPFESLLGMTRLVLSVDWDPIGAFGHRETLDEYDRYAIPVAKLLAEKPTVEAIAQLLQELETAVIRSVSLTPRMIVAQKLWQVAALEEKRQQRLSESQVS